MGTILQFRQPATDTLTAGDVQAGLKHGFKESAEIIIFPGVRIERADEPDTPDTEPQSRKRTKRTARRKI